MFMFNSSLATTPSVDIELDSYSMNRRSSTGVLLSPEVEISNSTTKTVSGETSESDGFYLLKKDSQRRATLSKVLSHDEKKICDVWIIKIENDRKEKVVINLVSLLFNILFTD